MEPLQLLIELNAVECEDLACETTINFIKDPILKIGLFYIRLNSVH